MTTELLRRWGADNKQATAERLATRFLTLEPAAAMAPAAREAASLWAGRSGRWSMLALASESHSLMQQDPSRSITVERLFAEALTQSGRPAEARAWWEYLVDRRECHDFPTLLRCAETAAPIAELEQAAERIAAARMAADGEPTRVVLVDAVAAELAIRRARFDDARELLEGIVRNAHSPASLRGRAQWLIGETLYLQQLFPEAIEAYRLVEGVDESGSFVAAALVQAGKSFEQLGRTRDATVCYLTLMNRFADSEHASLARRRLAALSPDKAETSPENPARTGTMRR